MAPQLAANVHTLINVILEQNASKISVRTVELGDIEIICNHVKFAALGRIQQREPQPVLIVKLVNTVPVEPPHVTCADPVK